MTAQASERIIYGGKEIMLFSNPLGPYLRAAKIQFKSPSTALWRGYIGTWEVIQSGGVERLYLVELLAHKSYQEELNLSDIFPGYDKVFAHWFTGVLRCPQGALLDYVHGGYSSTYEYDLLMDFKQGVLVNTHARHNENPKKATQ